MANIYYCQSINRGCGILRAVLSWEEGRSLLQLQSFRYSGQPFAATPEDQAADYAVLRVFDEERDEEWQSGFYRFDADLMRIEEAVQACTARSAEVGVQQANCPTPKSSPVRKEKQTRRTLRRR